MRRWIRRAPTLAAVLLAIVTPSSQDAEAPDIRGGELAEDDLPDRFRRNGLI